MYSSLIKFNYDFLPYFRKISDIVTDKLDIKWIEYTRIYKNGKRFYISNNQEWFKYFIQNKLYEDQEHNAILLDCVNRKYTLWAGLNDNKVLSGYFKNDMWNGIIYSLEQNENFIDLFSLSSNIEKKYLNNLYINNTDIIKKSILFFKLEVYRYLPIEDDKFLFKTECPNVLPMTTHPDIPPKLIDEFYEQTKINRYYFNIEKCEFYLTRMEFMCLTFLSQGLSIKEIANACLISPRTVETHINSIKLKTGKTNRCDLISILNNSPLDFSKDYVKRI